jgi:hypothetical protein
MSSPESRRVRLPPQAGLPGGQRDRVARVGGGWGVGGKGLGTGVTEPTVYFRDGQWQYGLPSQPLRRHQRVRAHSHECVDALLLDPNDAGCCFPAMPRSVVQFSRLPRWTAQGPLRMHAVPPLMP